MEEKDFVYFYAKDYIVDVVKSTICEENWESDDADNRYREFVQMFNNFKGLYMNESIEKFQTRLTYARKSLVANFNKNFKENFISVLKKYNANIKEIDLSNLLKEIDSISSTENIEYKVLNKIRDLECKSL